MTETGDFVMSLINQTIEAISKGRRHVVIWGATVEGLQVLSYLVQNGFSSYISGFVDQRRSVQGQEFSGHKVISPEYLPNLKIDTLVVASDRHKELFIEEYIKWDKRFPDVIMSGNENYAFDDLIYYQLVKSCPIKSKAGGYPNMLIHLYQGLKYVVQNNLIGDVVEFGTYQGGTTVFIAKVLQHYECQKKIYSFDTFSGFPPPRSVLDVFKDSNFEFSDFETVSTYCSKYNIELVRGDIFETIKKLRNIPLSFSFFDTDNYSPTRVALELCFSQTIKGGILAFDHFYSPGWNTTIGERIAIRQMLSDKSVLNLYGTGIFIKL